MKPPPKLDRKELKRPDEFVKVGQRLLMTLAGYQGAWISVAALVIAVAVGVYGYNQWSDSQVEKSWKGYLDATRQPDEKRWEELKAFYAKSHSSRPKLLAAVAVAEHYYKDALKETLKEGGDATSISNQSVEWYEKALKYTRLLDTERQLLTINRGNSYEVGKRLDEAYSDYKKASEMEGDAKAVGLIGMARIHELKNEVDKAIAVYTQASSQFADSEYGKIAKNYSHRLKSPLYKADPNRL